MPRYTIAELQNLKKKKEKIVSLSCYSYPTAKIADSLCEIILVGDSVGMVLYGMDSTTDVTLEMMISHGKAVCSATNRAFIVVDMPYGTYKNKELALHNAQNILQETKAQAIKLEGGQEMAEIIAYLVQHNVPTMAHIGLLPQSCAQRKDLKIQGKTGEGRQQLVQDVIAVTEAGAFAVVIEGVIKAGADMICENTDIITIGIGATNNCDGQILVIDDIIGNSNYTPRFAKIYADSTSLIQRALTNYKQEIKSGIFPGRDNFYKNL